MADENDIQLEQLLIEIKAYFDQLNDTLEEKIPKEMCKTKEKFKEIIALAGELDDCFTKQ